MALIVIPFCKTTPYTDSVGASLKFSSKSHVELSLKNHMQIRRENNGEPNPIISSKHKVHQRKDFKFLFLTEVASMT